MRGEGYEGGLAYAHGRGRENDHDHGDGRESGHELVRGRCWTKTNDGKSDVQNWIDTYWQNIWIEHRTESAVTDSKKNKSERTVASASVDKTENVGVVSSRTNMIVSKVATGAEVAGAVE